MKEMPKWRKAVKQAMHQATLQEAQHRFGTPTPTFNYRWEHVQAVVALARKLAQLTGADQDIVEASAWLHDIRKDMGDDHPTAGATFARQFLPQTDFPPHKIERVAQAIASHMGLWRNKPLKKLESQILWDADKLAKIGLTAVFHGAGLKLAKGKPQTTMGLSSHNKSMAWMPKTVASMHTEPARRAAQKRLHAYQQLWLTLEAELHGHDLDSD